MRKLFFWTVYAVLLTAVTVAGAEAIASFMAPPWPARELRPVPTGSVAQATGHVFDVAYNSWGMRDRERSVTRPAGIGFRAVMVGDSFLEGPFLQATLGDHIERLWQAGGVRDAEAINLGVAATGPAQYFHRIDKIALELRPDAVVLLFYSGNDFIYERPDGLLPAPIAELPLPSLLGSVAPRLTWLTVNRLALSEIGRNNRPIAGEFETLQRIVAAPANERATRLAAHVRQHYHPNLTEEAVREVFVRDGGAFWQAFERREPDREYLLGWLVRSIVDWETGSGTVPASVAEAERSLDTRPVEASLAWLVRSAELARARGVKFIVALAPVGYGDNAYLHYWRRWPRYFGYSITSEARHRLLAARLAERGVPFVDLHAVFAGSNRTYRLIDGHWTTLGHEMAAARLVGELAKLRAGP